MRLDMVLVAFLVVTAFFTGGLIMINEFRSTNENIGVNFTVEEFEGTFDYIDETFGLGDKAQDDVLQMELEGTDQSWESMTKGSYKGVRDVAINSFGLFNNVTYSVSNVLKIPPVFTKLAFTAFTIVMVFSLIYMIFRFKP